MAYVKVLCNNIAQFVSETDHQRLYELKRNFNATLDVDSTGFKKYTEDDVLASFGRTKEARSIESIFGVPTPVAPKSIDEIFGTQDQPTPSKVTAPPKE